MKAGRSPSDVGMSNDRAARGRAECKGVMATWQLTRTTNERRGERAEPHAERRSG